MQSNKHIRGSSKIANPSSKSAKAKDKERAVESNQKRPPSQLKQGWALVPLVLNSADNSADKKRSRSPTKRHSVADRSPSKTGKKAKLTTVERTIAIEIASDSDEDEIQEITVASTSKLTTGNTLRSASTSALAVKREVVELDLTSQESATKAVQEEPETPVIDELFDLEDERDESSEDWQVVQRLDDAVAFAHENEALEDVDNWGDAEQSWRRSRSGSLAGSAWVEEFDEQDKEAYNRSGDSDEDIRELMENEEDPIDPYSSARTKSGVRGDSKTPAKSLLKPLSSLRRSVSPAAGCSKITSDSRPNAFTALMQGNSLDKQWSEAAENEAQPWRKGYVRPAPFYKILDGMNIAVDAFKYGKIPNVEAYFLSHAHSDHYTNLSSSWCNGPIYCSIGTANLIRYKLGVKDEWLHPLEFDRVYDIAGTKVTLLDANHCPGSSIFVFEGPHTSPSSPYHKSPKKIFRYLHCGDFRASPAHLHHPTLKGKKVDICYLDTTYLNPRYCFPAQEQVVDACAELIKCRVQGDREALMRGSGGGAQLVRQGEMMKGWLSKAKKEEEDEQSMPLAVDVDEKPPRPPRPPERLLVMVGTYSIGKERIVKGIARAINAKIYCDQRKKEIFACQDDPELMSMVTDDPLEGQIHVTWLGQIKVDELSDYLDKYKPHFTSIVGLRPTGWTFKPEGTMALTLKNPSVLQMISRELQRSYNPSWMTPTKDSTRTVEAYGVPYSEHSSFAELTCFAVSLDCVRFIPTVNVGSKKSRQNMAVWFDKWAGERKRRKAAGEPLMVPHRTMQYW